MGQVRVLPTPVSGVRLADAVRIYLATITVPNTRATYAAALDRLVADFGADTNVALRDREPDRVSGWFTFVWGGKAAKTFKIRLTALAAACGYWREQRWPAGDPLVRLRARPAPPNTSKALSRERVAEIGCGAAGTGVVAHALRVLGERRGGGDAGGGGTRYGETECGGDT